jgi:hypothetical protein
MSHKKAEAFLEAGDGFITARKTQQRLDHHVVGNTWLSFF